MKITELQKSNTAKYCTDKFSDHSYGEFYDKLFAGKEDAMISIMEVGIYEGGSVKLWRDYLKSTYIAGVDIVDRINIFPPNIPAWFYNMDLWFIDAYSSECDIVAKKRGKFDIIIDDGSHLLADQIYAIKNFPSYLKSGGVLVIEDVPEGCEDEILKNVPNGGTVEVLNLRHIKNRWDDYLIVFKKD